MFPKVSDTDYETLKGIPVYYNVYLYLFLLYILAIGNVKLFKSNNFTLPNFIKSNTFSIFHVTAWNNSVKVVFFQGNTRHGSTVTKLLMSGLLKYSSKTDFLNLTLGQTVKGGYQNESLTLIEIVVMIGGFVSFEIQLLVCRLYVTEIP
jgi:hypothetical protein